MRFDDVAAWKSRIADAMAQANPSTLRVALAWAGSPAHRNDRHRSLQLSQLAPLTTANAVFFSVQKGPSATQTASPPAGMRLIDLADKLSDLADTAAAIASVDLVICVDTSIAHLAGSLGKPVWVLLPFHPDWRWLLNRNDSPWYPTMRLFRQNRLGDWNPVIE